MTRSAPPLPSDAITRASFMCLAPPSRSSAARAELAPRELLRDAAAQAVARQQDERERRGKHQQRARFPRERSSKTPELPAENGVARRLHRAFDEEPWHRPEP